VRYAQTCCCCCCWCGLGLQARVISSWYASSAGAQHLGFAKLWLFDNALGDAAAAALAPLIGGILQCLLAVDSSVDAVGPPSCCCCVVHSIACSLHPALPFRCCMTMSARNITCISQKDVLCVHILHQQALGHHCHPPVHNGEYLPRHRDALQLFLQSAAGSHSFLLAFTNSLVCTPLRSI
jgi:hypothetical protein